MSDKVFEFTHAEAIAEIVRLRGERLIAYLAMRGVTFPDGADADGTVAALIEAVRVAKVSMAHGEPNSAIAARLTIVLRPFEVGAGNDANRDGARPTAPTQYER